MSNTGTLTALLAIGIGLFIGHGIGKIICGLLDLRWITRKEKAEKEAERKREEERKEYRRKFDEDMARMDKEFAETHERLTGEKYDPEKARREMNTLMWKYAYSKNFPPDDVQHVVVWNRKGLL